jgi:phenylalanyl-tRNA synthetase alpha chain
MNFKFQESDAIVYEYLKDKKSASLEEILRDTNYNQDSIRRSIETLKLNGIIDESTTISYDYELDINGKIALDKGFIEEVFCNFLKDKSLKITELNSKSIPGLTKEDTTLAFGLAKRKELIEIVSGEIKLKKDYQEKISKQKEILSAISLKKPISETPEFQDIIKRKDFVIKKEKQNKVYKLLQIVSFDMISDKQLYLTPELLKTGEYKNIDFKEFEVSILPMPKEQGRINPLRQVIYQVRELYLEMGFKEMQGPYVESCFWNMDSMFISQNHPARDIQDTFYLNLSGDLPTEKNLTSQIAEIHNNGWKTGSKGYQYDWNEEESKKLILRTHTTATTYRTFFNLTAEEKDNSKYFCIDKVFRNETIDFTHLPEFHQAEGFIIGDNLSLADLLSFIKEFFNRLGIKKVKFKPTYNPYTEPSVEASGYQESTGKWIELINAGVFRPESLAPYGIEKTVIAWGLGLERLAMLLYQKPIKEIHGDEQDIDWLKEYILPKREL